MPVLGICYGMQLACDVSGRPGGKRPGAGVWPCAHCRVVSDDELFAGVPEDLQVWMSHGDQVSHVSATISSRWPRPTPARSPRSSIAAQPVYGLQFHPEVTHTPQGQLILGNFLKTICQCSGKWKIGDFAREAIETIRDRVGKGRVICGLSGGVDSSVVAALLVEAIGPQVSCILVDNGLLRAGEAAAVIEEFTNHFKTDLHVVHAEDRFLAALDGIVDPQEKRRRIGHAFIECFADEAARIEGAEFLAQGTLYPDVIESGGSPTARPPRSSCITTSAACRKTWPSRSSSRSATCSRTRSAPWACGSACRKTLSGGIRSPGRGWRCAASGRLPSRGWTRSARPTRSWFREIKQAGLYRQTSQVFAVLLPVQSVGVMGDARTYADALAIRAVETEDFMTADWSRLPYDLLARMSTRIINEVPGVNRVVYDISLEAAGDDRVGVSIFKMAPVSALVAIAAYRASQPVVNRGDIGLNLSPVRPILRRSAGREANGRECRSQ